ncbi:MAG: tyrosine-type recombinase/integrase [Planctomycetes bacterium]|nr:tyrosine-type recombinase/integrase [Planctomycetota bacterium]
MARTRRSRNPYPGLSLFRRNKNGALIMTWADPNTGRRKQMSLSERGLRTRVEAHEFCQSFSQKLQADKLAVERGESRPNEVKTWAQIMATYLEQYAADKGSAAARRVDYELNTFRTWLSGPGKLCRLGKDMSRLMLVSISDFLKVLKKQHAVSGKRGAYEPSDDPATPATKNSRRATIIALLNWARRREYLSVSSDDIRDRIPKFKQERKVPSALSTEALSCLIRAAVTCDRLRCFSGRHDKQAYHRGLASDAAPMRYKPVTPLMLLLTMTGMRLGEALHVRWENVDFERRIIKVCADPASGWMVKTRNERLVPLGDCPALEKLLLGLKLGCGANRYVIAGDDPDRPREFNRPAWERVVEIAGLSNASPKVLRSTFATALGSARGGPTPYELAGRMGHSVEVAAKHYVAPTEARRGACVEDWLGIVDAVANALTELGFGLPKRLLEATSA